MTQGEALPLTRCWAPAPTHPEGVPPPPRHVHIPGPGGLITQHGRARALSRATPPGRSWYASARSVDHRRPVRQDSRTTAARSQDATSRAGQKRGQRPGHGYPRARSCVRHAHAGALDCCAGRVLHPRPLVLTSCPRCGPVPNRGGPVRAPAHGFRPRIAVETSAPTLEWHSATGRRRSQRDRCQRPAAST